MIHAPDGDIAEIAGDLTCAEPAVVSLTPADLGEVGAELAAYHAHFASCFARREQREWAAVYLRGLLLADVARKNVEALALRLLGAGPQAQAARPVRALQQFIGEGAWDDTALLAEHHRLVAASLGEADGVLILDGSDVPQCAQARRPLGRGRCPVVWGDGQDRYLPGRGLPRLCQPQGLHAAGSAALPA
jgi:hypothetical protein